LSAQAPLAWTLSNTSPRAAPGRAYRDAGRAGRDLDIITKNAMLTMLDEHHVEQHMNTQLMAVTPTISP
jgi:hypothetical protein